jgi:hypothetical protein
VRLAEKRKSELAKEEEERKRKEAEKAAAAARNKPAAACPHCSMSFTIRAQLTAHLASAH